MKSSFSLGRILGFPVRVHFTLILLLAFIGLAGGGALGVLLTVLTFASVLAHELGHSVVARGLSVPIAEIVLYPFGGMAKMAAAPKKPADEILIAAAGPAVSLILAGIFGALWLLGAPALVGHLALVNGILGVFNLIPALPMDGGRIFRAALVERLGYVKATRVAARVARVAAVGLGVAGVFYSPMLVVIAVLVWWMAGAEERAAETTQARAMTFDPDLGWILRDLERRGPGPSRASGMTVDVR